MADHVEVVQHLGPQMFRTRVDGIEWDVHVHDGPDVSLQSGMPFAWYLAFYEPGTNRQHRMPTRTAKYRALRKAVLKAIFDWVDSTRKEK